MQRLTDQRIKHGLTIWMGNPMRSNTTLSGRQSYLTMELTLLGQQEGEKGLYWLLMGKRYILVTRYFGGQSSTNMVT